MVALKTKFGYNEIKLVSDMAKDFPSTYERLIHEDPTFKEDLEKRYKEFILSELLLAAMEEDHISIRKLAKEAGVSPSLIQDLRSGKKDNLTFRSFSHIVDALGYDIVLEKRLKRSPTPKKLKMSPLRRTTKKQIHA
jgi:DNA-binding Xre family transcriptional regulator